MFAVTWLSYASYYLTRKNFSVAKKRIESEEGLSRADLGHIDTGFLAAYSLGQFLWGFVADRVGSRFVIGFGMLATAGVSIAFGHAGAFAAFAGLWALNGLVQATGWSPNVKAMTAATPKSGRGTIMGVWATCYIIGSLVANPIAAYFMLRGGWSDAFVYPAIAVAAMGIIVLVALPRGAGAAGGGGKGKPAIPAEERRAARRKLLRTPLLWALGASYFFMKLTRYALFFWLPYYMKGELGYTDWQAANVPLAFEAGGAIGALALGWWSERWFAGRRVPLAVGSLVLLAASLFVFAGTSEAGIVANLACLAAAGFFLYGPDALVSSTAAQDLGGPAAAATAAGVINGLGSIGPIVGSEFVAPISKGWGWGALFALLGAGAVVSAVILAPFWRVGRRDA